MLAGLKDRNSCIAFVFVRLKGLLSGVLLLRLDHVNCISCMHTLSNAFPNPWRSIIVLKTSLHVGTRRGSLGVCLSGCGCSRPGAGGDLPASLLLPG